ncbi:MAG: serine/threonine protein kinase/Tfp pilus assembly protein PilF [Chlamydiales bacterium]|jgi:serine/threonine protein kinase/Tfp pilus assembly protein PilF
MITCTQCGHQASAFAFCPECGTKAGSESTVIESLEGRILNDKYRVLEKIGQGSMGTVYRGEHIGLKKTVALKVLHEDLHVGEETLQRFQREGIALGKIAHPNAIQIFDFDRDGSRTTYLAMEFVEGQNLKALLRESSNLPVSSALSIIEQVLLALQEAHRHGIVHRDLKPDNIMVAMDASGAPRVKVLDFGLSKLVDLPMEASVATQVGRIMGTPLYMAPEQCSGEEVDLRADLYATGLVLYEMVAGSTPFAGDSVTEIFAQHLTKPTPSVVESHPDLKIAPALDPLLHRSLAKRREDRFQTATEMLDAVRQLQRGEYHESLPAHSRPKPKVDSGPRSARPWLVAASVVLLSLAGWWLAGTLGSAGGAAPRLRMRSNRTEIEERYVGHLIEAESALKERDTDVAFSALSDAVALISDDSEIYYLRAQASLRKGDDEGAVLDFEEALKYDPNYAAAIAGIGWIELDRSELDAAELHFQAALDMDPRSAIGITGQAAIALERNELADAQRLLSIATDLDPDSSATHVLAGDLRLLRGDIPGAIDAFVRAKRSDSRNAEAYAGLGAAYLRQNRPNDAEQQLIEALSRDPDAHDVRAMFASLLVDKGRFADATRQLQQGLQRDPKNTRMRVLSAITAQASGDDTVAIRELEGAVNSGTVSPSVRTLLATLYQKTGQPTLALEQVEAAIETAPDFAPAHVQRGVLLFVLERYMNAAEALETGLRLSPDDAFGHYTLGILCMDYLGRPEDALEHLERYLALGGRDTQVRNWVRNLAR